VLSDRLDPMSTREASEWRNSLQDGSGLGVFDFIGQTVSVARALAVGSLIWPQFEEARGCVLLAGRNAAASVDQWWDQLHGTPSRIESVLNHVHLWDVFPSDHDINDGGAFRELARLMQAGWRSALASDYPHRTFEVICTGLAAEDPEYGPTLTFCSSRDRGRR